MMMMMMAGGAIAQPYAPPERMWYKIAPWYNDSDIQFFHDVTWLGDQNGDGCDELLVANEPRFREERGDEHFVNNVELYFGSARMDTTADIVFHPTRQYEVFGIAVTYLGDFTGEGPFDFAIQTGTYDGADPAQFYDIMNWYVNIYQGGARLDTIPDYTISHRGLFMRLINNSCPFDLNGDGYNDLMVLMDDHDHTEDLLYIYFGGAEFDTVEDVILHNRDLGYFGLNGIQAGKDVNGDGCDDLLICSLNLHPGPEHGNYFGLYLGGDSIMSVPRFAWRTESIAGFYLGDAGFVGDVNGDGFGDWSLAMVNINHGDAEASWVYFGSDRLDSIPDRFPVPGESPGSGQPFGGDANGDGRGDLLLNGLGYGMGDIRTYLGSNWFDEHWAVRLNGQDVLGMGTMELRQGAYGDFNGDGAGDIVVIGYAGHGTPRRMAIYPGSRGWRLDVPNEYKTPIPKDLEVVAYPNPFNNQSFVTFQLPERGELNVVLYDLAGRRVQTFERHIAAPGSQSLLISGGGFSSGIYYLVADLTAVTERFQTKAKIVHIQ